MTSEIDRVAYFGMWSKAKIDQATHLLDSLDVGYEITLDETDQDILEAWYAWDPDAENPNLGFDLWIFRTDLEKLGSKLVEAFPERSFDS